MTNVFQFNEISNHIKNYVLSILLSTRKKNVSAMAEEVDITKKQLYRIYQNPKSHSEEIKDSLVKIIKQNHSDSKPSVFIVDPTIIRKWFAKNIDGLSSDFDGVIQKSKACLVPVIAAWTNTKITIPFDFKFWINEKFTEVYKKKTDIAQLLILEFVKTIKTDYVTLDGAFASKGMIEFFIKNLIHFCMRIPRNRVVVSQKGVEAQLQNHPELKLKKNQRYKTIRGTYKGSKCFFTAHKAYSKPGRKPRIVFIVSDLNISPKEQAKAYGIRWNIEKAFRTMKQSLGLSDCQCLDSEKQRAHIFATFLAYAKLEEKKSNKAKSPEAVLKIIRRRKPSESCKRSLLGTEYYA